MFKPGVIPLFILLLNLIMPFAGAGLIAYYSFDSDNAADLSGNSNNGQVGSGIVFTTDTPFGTGKAMNSPASGSNYVVTVPTSTSLEGIEDQLTLSFWMKATVADQDNNWGRLFQHGEESDDNDPAWLVDRYNNTDETNIRVDTTGASGQFNQNLAENENPGSFDGQWHHVLYTLNNGTWEEYQDGTRVSGTYAHGNGFANSRPLYIGGRYGTSEYNGLLDDIGVWDTAIDTAEARSIFTTPTTFGVDYDLGDMMLLWNIHDLGSGSAGVVDGTLWTFTNNLPGTPDPGDAYVAGFRRYLALGDGSTGLVAVPEPSSVILALAGLLALGGRRRRR